MEKNKLHFQEKKNISLQKLLLFQMEVSKRSVFIAKCSWCKTLQENFGREKTSGTFTVELSKPYFQRKYGSKYAVAIWALGAHNGKYKMFFDDNSELEKESSDYNFWRSSSRFYNGFEYGHHQ